jgi:hypothetical protein
MTAQIGDSLLWDGVPHTAAGVLPLPDVQTADIVQATVAGEDYDARDAFAWSSACWRGFISHWRLERDQLWLDSIRGRYRVVGGPLRADWVTCLVRVPKGELESYIHAGLGSSFHAMAELDFRAGRLHRMRVFEDPANGEDRLWLDHPRTAALFARRSEEILEPPPLSPRKRSACAAARAATRLRAGELARTLGLGEQAAGRIGQWENGSRGMHPAWINAVADHFGVDAAMRARLDAEDEADAQRAREAFLDTPIVPTLVSEEGFQQERWCPPPGMPDHRQALLDWARACVEASWRPATLWLSRREKVRLDRDAQECT